jgi:AcrR family transcriptional regulator
MERIAAEAGVARATVYAYFTDKEHAFLHVSQRLAQRLAAAVAAALAGPEPPAVRIRNAVLGKYELIFAVARLSPHAADLLAAKDRLAGPVFAGAEARILAAVETEIAALGLAGPAEMTATLFSAAKGVADAAPDLTALRSRLTRLVDALLAAAAGTTG